MRCDLSRQIRGLEPLGPRPDLSHAAVKRRPDKSLGGGAGSPSGANATFDDSVWGDHSTQPQRGSGIAEKFNWACMGPQELINQPSQHGPEMPSASVQVHAARSLGTRVTRSLTAITSGSSIGSAQTGHTPRP